MDKTTKDMNAKVESMLLHQVLEEHIKARKCKKKFEPCLGCIRIALNKGYERGKLDLHKHYFKDFKEPIITEGFINKGEQSK